MKPTIDDLLNALNNPNVPSDKNKLENTRDTWTRIGTKDSFSELGLDRSSLDDFLKEWVQENEYNNIS